MESVEESLSSLKEKSMNRDKEHRVVYMDSRNELGAGWQIYEISELRELREFLLYNTIEWLRDGQCRRVSLKFKRKIYE